MKIMQWLGELLFPPKCILCRRILEAEELDLCHKCRIESPQWAAKHAEYPFLDSLTALWYYEDHVRQSILRYKFSGYRHYADAYGRLLAMHLQDMEFDVLTWIPVSQKRKKKRGFDQVQLLAESVGRELGITPVALLKNTLDNPPQSNITGRAERKANVLGVYRVEDAGAAKGKKILLLDDIITTGATAGECARVLLTAGAQEVHCAVLAAVRQSNKK